MVQGAPCATVDTDIWVDLPVSQYVRILTIAQRLGTNIRSGCVVGLRDDHRIDFIYRIDGPPLFRPSGRARSRWNGPGRK